MKEIELTRGLVTQVDDEDFDYLNQWKWYAHLSRNRNFYAARRDYKKGMREIWWMHRFIINPAGNNQVDHINGNGFDNRRINLRECTHSQNMSNRKSCGRSRYLGVSFDRKKYKASIGKNGIIYHLGLFDTEIEAAIAYNNSALKFHGEFANLNRIA